MANPSAVVYHPFGLAYLWLKFRAIILRCLSYPIQYRGIQKQKSRIANIEVMRNMTRVPSREEGRFITVHMYTPKGNLLKSTAAHLDFHGSGFVIPSLGTDTEFCVKVASTVGCVVIDCDYRKAPEYPFPAAIEDAEDVALYFIEHGEKYGLGAPYVTASGFSAGGNIALVLSIRLGSQCRGVSSMYSNPDMTKTANAPRAEYDSGMIISPSLRALFYRALILPDQSRSDTRLSPAFVETNKFPPHVFLACGDADSLYNANDELVKRLKDDGHQDVVFIGVEREAHGFDKRYIEGSETESRVREVYDGAIGCLTRARQ